MKQNGTQTDRWAPDVDPRPSAFLLASDQVAERRLEDLCEAMHLIEVVACARDLDAATRFLGNRHVDVVLVDLDGSPAPLVAIDTLRGLLRDAWIVVWADGVELFEEVFAAGADAWITRSAEPTTLAATIALRAGRTRDA